MQRHLHVLKTITLALCFFFLFGCAAQPISVTQPISAPLATQLPNKNTLDVPNNDFAEQDYVALALKLIEEMKEPEKNTIQAFASAIEQEPDRPELYIVLALCYLDNGQKQNALKIVSEALLISGVSRESILEIWQRIYLRPESVAQPALSYLEMKNLSIVGYLLHFNECFISTDKLDKEELLLPLVIFYSSEIPILWDAEWKSVDSWNAYQADRTEEDAVYLSVGKANAFIFDTLGTNIPDLNKDFGDDFDNEDIRFQNNEFVIPFADIIMHNLYVSGYRYLGDGLYYIVFDGDDSWLPGPPEESEGIIPDFMRLIVKKSDCPWGFTVVAKLKGFWGQPQKEDWVLPPDMTTIENVAKEYTR